MFHKSPVVCTCKQLYLICEPRIFCFIKLKFKKMKDI